MNNVEAFDASDRRPPNAPMVEIIHFLCIGIVYKQVQNSTIPHFHIHNLIECWTIR